MYIVDWKAVNLILGMQRLTRPALSGEKLAFLCL